MSHRYAKLTVAGLTGAALLLQLTASAAPRAEADVEAGVPPDGLGVHLGPLFSVEDPGPGYVAAFPGAYGVDTVVDGRTTKRVFVSYARNPDEATADSRTGVRISDDGGTSYPEFQDNTSSVLSATRLADGRLFATQFIPEWTDDSHTSVDIVSRISDDLGDTWSTVKGRFAPPDGSEFGTFDRGLRVHQGIVLLADGTLLVPAYTRYADDPRGRSILLQSTDAGRTWTQRSTIVAPTESQGVNEVGIARTADGSLLAVLRTEGGSPNLLQTRSVDDGATWSDPVQVQGPAGADTASVAPVLNLLPNGVLLLSYGRPDNKLLVSYDGTGETWDEYHVTYANAPDDEGSGRVHGSSGYTALVDAGSNRSLLIGDACATTWGCKEYNEDYGIWSRHVDVVTPDDGKIDLATKAIAGTVTVDGSFAPSDPAFPESRPEGAFDGSAEPAAAAMLDDPATMTVTLDRTHTLRRIGLMLAYGKAQDADVSFSRDGTTWSDPVVSARDRTDYAMRYENFQAQQAKYVRIQAPEGGTLSAVTELELYSDVDSFENDPVFDAPRGFTDVQLANVTDVELGGRDSERSLRLLDFSTKEPATATRWYGDSAAKRVGFAWAPGVFGDAFLFDVRGKDADGAGVTPWHFALRPVSGTTDAELAVYDGSEWHVLGTASGVGETGRWTDISIDASTTAATVRVGSEEFATDIRWQPATSLGGVTFASAGTAPDDMEFFVDDVYVAVP